MLHVMITMGMGHYIGITTSRVSVFKLGPVFATKEASCRCSVAGTTVKDYSSLTAAPVWQLFRKKV